MKNDVNQQIKDEFQELKNEIVEVKMFFEKQKDHVTQFDSTIQFLKKQSKVLKKELEDMNLSLSKEIENYRLDILRTEKAYNQFNNQIVQVTSQMIDLEHRFVSLQKNSIRGVQGVQKELDIVNKYLKVIQPMETHSQI